MSDTESLNNRITKLEKLVDKMQTTITHQGDIIAHLSATTQQIDNIILPSMSLKFFNLQKIDALLARKIESQTEYCIPYYLHDLLLKEQASKLNHLVSSIEDCQMANEKLLNADGKANLGKFKDLINDQTQAQEALRIANFSDFNNKYRLIEKVIKGIQNKCRILNYVQWIKYDSSMYDSQPWKGQLMEYASSTIAELFNFVDKNPQETADTKEKEKTIAMNYHNQKMLLIDPTIKAISTKFDDATNRFLLESTKLAIQSKKQEMNTKISKLIEKQKDLLFLNMNMNIARIPFMKQITDCSNESDEFIQSLESVIHWRSDDKVCILDPASKNVTDISIPGVNDMASSISIGKSIYFIGGNLCATTMLLSGSRLIACGDMSMKKYAHSLCQFANMIYSIGGIENQMKSLNDAEVFNTVDRVWYTMPNMHCGRISPAVFATPDNYLYAVGGCFGKNSKSMVERFNLSSSKWENVEVKGGQDCHSMMSMEGFALSSKEAIICGGNGIT